MLSDGWRLSQGVDDRGASNGDRRLLVPGQMGNGRLVDATPRVYVDSVDDLVRRFHPIHLMLSLILTGRCQKQTAVRCEGESPEKGSKSLIGIQTGILHAQAVARRMRFRRSLNRHNSWQRHGRCG